MNHLCKLPYFPYFQPLSDPEIHTSNHNNKTDSITIRIKHRPRSIYIVTITAPMRAGDKGLARLVQFTDDKDRKT